MIVAPAKLKVPDGLSNSIMDSKIGNQATFCLLDVEISKRRKVGERRSYSGLGKDCLNSVVLVQFALSEGLLQWTIGF